jgi:hypothetical protein
MVRPRVLSQSLTICTLLALQVIPMNEWWKFKKPSREGQKMTVNEAMDKMKMLQRGYAVAHKSLDAKMSATGRHILHSIAHCTV